MSSVAPLEHRWQRFEHLGPRLESDKVGKRTLVWYTTFTYLGSIDKALCIFSPRCNARINLDDGILGYIGALSGSRDGLMGNL